MKAARGYKDINLLAMKLLSPHGTLATFSCSGAMDATFFDKILAEASCDAERSFQVIARTSAGPDHPVSVSFPEGSYLKGVIMNALN
jgi:23S rRNA (cytosine1962-C5)-methyltransferase